MKKYFQRGVNTFFLFAFILLSSVSLSAQEAEKNDSINITSDSMKLYSDKNMTVFKGNVKAIQNETVITADSLNVFHKKSEDKNSKNSFEKIEASGNVEIKMEDKYAKSEKAVYLAKEEKLILTGNRPVIEDGENKITGDKITYFINTGVMEAEQDSDKQVEATFTDTEKKE
ncbi:MAG: lipopolysaccharide transport periplasmic protein LptA [Thermodesulfobacteriota bacterium]